MNRRNIGVDAGILNTYLKYVAEGQAEPTTEGFVFYQNTVKKCFNEAWAEEQKNKKYYMIDVNERIDYVHKVLIELPSDVEEELVWREIDCTDGTAELTDVNKVVENFGGNIIDFEVDVTPEKDIEVENVEVIDYEK